MGKSAFDELWSDFVESKETERSGYSRDCRQLIEWKEHRVLFLEFSQRKLKRSI